MGRPCIEWLYPHFLHFLVFTVVVISCDKKQQQQGVSILFGASGCSVPARDWQLLRRICALGQRRLATAARRTSGGGRGSFPRAWRATPHGRCDSGVTRCSSFIGLGNWHHAFACGSSCALSLVKYFVIRGKNRFCLVSHFKHFQWVISCFDLFSFDELKHGMIRTLGCLPEFSFFVYLMHAWPLLLFIHW